MSKLLLIGLYISGLIMGYFCETNLDIIGCIVFYIVGFYIGEWIYYLKRKK